MKGQSLQTYPIDMNIHVESRSVTLHRVFDLKLRRINLTEIILRSWNMNWQYAIYVSIREVELICCKANVKYKIIDAMSLWHKQ